MELQLGTCSSPYKCLSHYWMNQQDGPLCPTGEVPCTWGLVSQQGHWSSCWAGCDVHSKHPWSHLSSPTVKRERCGVINCHISVINTVLHSCDNHKIVTEVAYMTVQSYRDCKTVVRATASLGCASCPCGSACALPDPPPPRLFVSAPLENSLLL